MSSISLVFSCLILSGWLVWFDCFTRAEVPVCTSRYDFESRLLRSVIQLEFDMSVLKEQYKKDIEALSADIKTVTVNEQWTQSGQGESQKAPIVFNFRDLINIRPRENEVLVFSTELTNIGNAYDPDSGYFTASVEGTYSFSVYLCSNFNTSVFVELLVDEQIVARSNLYYEKEITCSSMTAFVYLKEGSRVCVRNTFGTAGYDNLFFETDYYWNVFMGALVH